MLFIKKISLVLFLLVATIFTGTVVSAQEKTQAEGVPATFGRMSIDADLVSVDFDQATRNINLKLSIKNNSDVFIDGVESLVMVYKGEALTAGDPFEQMEFTYAFENMIGGFSPFETRVIEIKNIPPQNINTANYFLKISFVDKTFKYFGITLTKEPLLISGTGGYLGGINETSFRTVKGDGYPLEGASVKSTDPAYIVIPLNNSNTKLANYVKNNEIFADIIITDSARSEKVFSTLKKEILPIVTENGVKTIKYQVKPWAGIKPGTYNIDFRIVDKNNVQIVDEANYRWLIEGLLFRIDSVDVKQNLFKKGDDLAVSFSTVVFDAFKEGSKIDAIAKLVLKSTDGTETTFSKKISLDKTSTFSFSDEQVKDEILVQEVILSIVNNTTGEVLDSLVTKMDTSKIFYPTLELEDLLIKYTSYIIGVVVLLMLLVIFWLVKFGNRKNLIIGIVLLLIGVAIILFGVFKKSEAGQGYSSLTASYDGSTLNFAVWCNHCLNGMTASWTAGNHSGNVTATNVNNDWAKTIQNVPGCSASVTPSGGANNSCPVPAKWSTDFCPSAPTNLTTICSPDGNSVDISWVLPSGADGSWPRLNPLNSSRCSSITGIPNWNLNAENTCYRDNTAGTSFTASIVPDQNYTFWVHSGLNTQASIHNSTTFNCPSLPITASCTVSTNLRPPSVTITPDTIVAWTANSTGMINPTYRWVSDNFVSATTTAKTFSGKYSNSGPKHASVTVTSSDGRSLVVPCVGTASSLGPTSTGGEGIIVYNSYSGVCATGGPQNEMPKVWCSSGDTRPNGDLYNPSGPWSWYCLGSQPMNDKSCSAYLKDVVIDPSLNCRLSASSTVNINTNTTWIATSTTHKNWSGYTKKWTVGGVAVDESEPDSNILNKIFTTTGVKQVGLTVGSSTSPRYRGDTCTTTTTVIQVGKLEEN
jgi:hypothetical protein